MVSLPHATYYQALLTACSFCPWPPMTARGALTAKPKLSHPDIDPSSPTAAFSEYQSPRNAPKALHGALLPPGPGDLLSPPGHSCTVTRSHARSTSLALAVPCARTLPPPSAEPLCHLPVLPLTSLSQRGHPHLPMLLTHAPGSTHALPLH